VPYAILRTAKLTSLGNVGGSAQHNFRERPTPNANQDVTPNNRTSGAQSSAEVLAAVKARLATQDRVRKNAVLAVEYFIGASPEWFQEQSKEAREAYFDQAEEWLKDRHGKENVIAVTRQYDETSPHVCAYVVPIDPAGKLNASHFLDGRQKLSQMQTDFAEKVGRQFKLERGIEGSKVQHKTVKQYYAEIQAPAREVTISSEDIKPKVLEKTFWQSYVETDEMVADRLTETVRDAYKPTISAAKQYHVEKAASASRAHELARLREMATVAREMPLEGVLERLGCERDAADWRKNWKTPAGRLTVEGTKFYAHDQGKGGGGAIDLVMMLEETDYKGAVNWLSREFGTGMVLDQAVMETKRTVEAAARALPQPYKAPEPVQENWPKVRRYLVEQRRIGGNLVDELHETGRIYADRYANAVFVLGRDGEGVELRGTGTTPFHGVRGEKMPFYLRGERGRVAFVESAIDAMSLRELGFKGGIISMAGSSADLSKIMADRIRDDGATVVAAFDNDRAGERMAMQLGEPQERARPKYGKDWNDDLRFSRASHEERQAMERARARSSSSGLSR
jgi:hypothetical protein